MYQIRILDAAIHELAKLDKIVKQRVIERVHWLAINLEQIKPEALSGNFAGLYKLRAGDYRIIVDTTTSVAGNSSIRSGDIGNW